MKKLKVGVTGDMENRVENKTNNHHLQAPVLLFVYNRPTQTEHALLSLGENDLANQTDLYIFCDSPRQGLDENNEAVKRIINQHAAHSSFKTVKITINTVHKGLAKSIEEGVSSVISQYGKVIVNEDDLVCQKNYLVYMNDCLEFYQNNNNIWSISGWSPILKNHCSEDIFATYRGCSWGWATWKDRWDSVDWNLSYNQVKFSLRKRHNICIAGPDNLRMLRDLSVGKIDSWAVLWVCSQALQDNKITIYPKHSFIHNIGLDGSGTHSGNTGNEDYSNYKERISYHLTDVSIKKKLLKEFNARYAGTPFPFNYVLRVYNHFFKRNR